MIEKTITLTPQERKSLITFLYLAHVDKDTLPEIYAKKSLISFKRIVPKKRRVEDFTKRNYPKGDKELTVTFPGPEKSLIVHYIDEYMDGTLTLVETNGIALSREDRGHLESIKMKLRNSP